MQSIRTAIAAALLFTPLAAQAQVVPPASMPGRQISIGTSYQIRSLIMDDTRELNVWLPTGYDKSTDRYPVLYLLDGGLDQDFQHIAGLGNLASLSWTFGPLIIVGIQTRDRRAELTPRLTDARYLTAFPNSGGATRFRTFLRDEVVPFVETRFRASNRRALMGESLGGLLVIDTLLNEPGLFGDYVAISPSLWWDDRRAMRALARQAEIKGLSNARLYLAMADEGGTMQDGVDRLRDFLGTQPTARITWRYADFSKAASHATIFHRAAEEALRWLYPAPPYPAGPTPWYMIDGAAPPPVR